MGRKFDLIFLSPRLKIGVTIADFHSAGIADCSIERLIKYVIDSDTG
jgi:hypothetical protein